MENRCPKCHKEVYPHLGVIQVMTGDWGVCTECLILLEKTKDGIKEKNLDKEE